MAHCTPWCSQFCGERAMCAASCLSMAVWLHYCSGGAAEALSAAPGNSEDVMEFQERTTPDAITVQISGRWEFTDHDCLADLVALMAQPETRRFVLDLSDLQFIDSAGLGMLLILQDETETRNIGFVVRKPQGDVKNSIELARIGDIINIEY
ncbi:STAS domain-containing protein [Azospirillum soli]|uniref:STAS domain-containing protein n=1 Tax=Azospirillum soli TaxID=1304799 RepID=UPI001FE29EF7|nr:STAS domain-containing protein [Azospirillum soli]MBP2313514.1 anti-anti-sigma factor [Azospirillum soli]